MEHMMWMRFQREQQQQQLQGTAGTNVSTGMNHGPPTPQSAWFHGQPTVRVGVSTSGRGPPLNSNTPSLHQPQPQVQHRYSQEAPHQSSKGTGRPQRKKRAVAGSNTARMPPANRSPPPSSASTASLSPALDPRSNGPVPPALDLPGTEGVGDELDERRLAQRAKQINFGKVTDGYRYYRLSVPHFQRQSENPNHPITPRITMKCSKRRWDTLVATWRRSLHAWDDEPNPSSMLISGLTTLEALGQATYQPLNVYVAETEKELADVKASILAMQSAKATPYPGETSGTEPDSSSDLDIAAGRGDVRQVLASAPPRDRTRSEAQEASVDGGEASTRETGRQTSISLDGCGGSSDPSFAVPYVPSPVDQTAASNPPGGVANDAMDIHSFDGMLAQQNYSPQMGNPSTAMMGQNVIGASANFIMLRVVQRCSNGDENEKIISVSSVGGAEGIHAELAKRFGDMSRVYFRLPAAGSITSPSHSPPAKHTGTSAAGKKLAKPQPLGGSRTNDGQGSPAAQPLTISPEERSVPSQDSHNVGASRQPQLFLDDIEHLHVLLQQPFAPTLYYLSDNVLPEDDLDVQRELQLTPTRVLYANCESMVSELIFSTNGVSASIYTPNPMAKAAQLSPTHFYDGSGLSPLMMMSGSGGASTKDQNSSGSRPRSGGNKRISSSTP